MLVCHYTEPTIQAYKIHVRVYNNIPITFISKTEDTFS